MNKPVKILIINVLSKLFNTFFLTFFVFFYPIRKENPPSLGDRKSYRKAHKQATWVNKNMPDLTKLMKTQPTFKVELGIELKFGTALVGLKEAIFFTSNGGFDWFMGQFLING